MDWFANSNAGHWTLFALASLAVAAIAWLGDWRRARRSRPDAVGWVPWTSVFMAGLLGGLIFGVLALASWASP